MKSETSKISARQLVVLLVASRIVSLLTRSTFSVTAAARDTVIGLLISAVLIILADRLFSRYEIKNRAVKKAACVVLAIYFIVASANSLVAFIVFFQTESETIYPTLIIALPMMLVVFYALSKGIEGIARFALIGALIFAAVMGFMLLANNSRADIANLSYGSIKSGSEILNTVISNTLLCTEIPAYFVLKRFIRKEDAHKRPFKMFFVLQTLVIGLFSVAQELVFGALVKLQQYPIYSLAVVGEISIFQRLDVLHLTMWCILTVIKLSAATAACEVAVRGIVPHKNHKYLNIFICGIVTVITLALPGIFSSQPGIVDWILIGLFILIALFSLTMLVGGKRDKLVSTAKI